MPFWSTKGQVVRKPREWASCMSTSRMCPSSTWTRTIFCNKIICKSSYISYPSQLVPCHPPRTTSERAVLVETSTLTTSLLQYVEVQCNEDLSHAYVQWRSNDETTCYSPATYKQKLGSSELGNFDPTFFLSGRHSGTRKWKVKLSGYAPLELRTKFCCPDTALGVLKLDTKFQ
jgi:hypothetical protein